MLVSAEVELTFFVVPSMGLCFGLVLNTELLIGKAKAFPDFCTTIQAREMQSLGGQEETQPGEVVPADKRGISGHVTSCSV